MGGSCPFCNYTSPQTREDILAINDIAYHIEVEHPEDFSCESPFKLRPASPLRYTCDRSNSATEQDQVNETNHADSVDSEGDMSTEYINCPKDCGEKILNAERAQHIALHQAESIALDELEGQYHNNLPETSTSSQFEGIDQPYKPGKDVLSHEARDRKRFPGLFYKSRGLKNRPQSSSYQVGQRQGKKELGPHAYEEQMPSWLYKQIERGPQITWINQLGSNGQMFRVEKIANETPNLVKHLASLCDQDGAVSKAWFCSPGVKHIYKMHREGGFCGYRNIQMLVSWIQHHKHTGHEKFPGSTPNILLLQQMIEDAWNKGFNSSGRAETGGIIGTRKFIGTPEAQALFQSLGIDCFAKAFTKSKIGDRRDPVHRVLLEQIVDYFSKGVQDPSDKVYMTSLPPIYFQHPGHSLTIVGIEIRKDGVANLLVFDPMFATASAMMRFMGSPSARADAEKILKAFRRGDSYLKKYVSFEILSFAALS